MPQTSALALLPPTPVASPPSSSYSTSSDTSFQDSLTSAQQRQSTPAPAPDKAVNKPAASVKNAGKKVKAKAIVTTKKSALESDSSDETATAKEAAAKAEIPQDATDIPTQVPADAKGEPDAKPTPAPVPLEQAVVVAEAVKPDAAAVLPHEISAANQPPKPSAHKPTVVKAPEPDQSQTTQANAIALEQKKTISTDVTTPQASAAPATEPNAKVVAVKTTPADATDASKASNDDSGQAKAKTTAPKQAAPVDTSPAAAVAAEALASDDTTDDTQDLATGPTAAGISSTFDQQLQRVLGPLVPKVEAPTPTPQTDPTPFADINHPGIVTGVHSQLLPNGGTMQLKLNPPDLGELQVTVQMRNGNMTAAFETSNEQATRLLSHSLNQLKTALETTGVSVERMHVQQSPRQESKGNSQSDSQQQKSQDPEQQQQSRQEQQRRQMLQRMWNKLSGQGDPLDLVA